MTYPKNFAWGVATSAYQIEGSPLAAMHPTVAEAWKGLAKGAEVVWAPPVLRYVFSVMRHLPRPLWRKVAAR